MIKVEVKNLQGQITNSAQFDSQSEADDWIQEQTVSGSFGKADRWVDSADILSFGEDISKAVESKQVGSDSDARTQYHFAAEFSVVQTDISAQVAQQKANDEAKAYLASTDWYVIRSAETPSKLIPADILAARAAARASIVKV